MRLRKITAPISRQVVVLTMAALLAAATAAQEIAPTGSDERFSDQDGRRHEDAGSLGCNSSSLWIRGWSWHGTE